MTIFINDILQKLYSITFTPKIADYLNNPEIQSLIDYIKKSHIRETDYQDATDEDIEEIICFLLRLVNTPEDLRGALAVEMSIMYLVESALNIINLQHPYNNSIIAIAKEWFEALKQSPHKKSFIKKPHIEKSPLLMFHVMAFKDSELSQNKIRTLYKAYAFKIHIDIRHNENLNIERTTHISYIRAARFFFYYISDGIKNKSQHEPEIPDEYIKIFIDRYKEINKGNINTPSDTAENYERMFISLITRKELKPKHFLGRISDTYIDFSPPDGTVETFEPENSPPEFNHVELEHDSEEEVDEFADFESSHRDPDYIFINEKDKTIPIKPSLGRNWMDIINLRSYHFYWDSTYINLFHYSIIYKVISDLWDKSSFYNSVITYLYLLMHTGIDSRCLLDLSYTDDANHPNNDLSDSNLKLTKINNRFYILVPTIVNLGRIEERHNCLNTSNKIHVPLPDAVNKMISKLQLKSKYVFSYKNKKNRTVRLDLEIIEEFIEKMINRAYPQYKLKITLSRISRSFIPLYSRRYGLDPIIGCHISGIDYFRLYGSQLHYIYVPHDKLEKQYLSTHKLVESSIQKNLSMCIKEGFIKGNINKKCLLFDLSSEAIATPANTNFAGYGSTIICNKDYIFGIINTLKKAILNERDYIKRHNLYSIYVYMGLQYSTGLRPRNDPEIKWNYFNLHAGAIVIKDKQSSKYHEERILRLPALLKKLLNRMLLGFDKLQLYIAKNLFPSTLAEKRERIFFFIDDNGRFIDFTLNRTKETLKGIGIDYYLPANMPRHYMRNYLFHSGISNDIADIFMGHQHAGREMMNITSSAITKEIMMECLPIIETMLTDIGFEDLKYL